MSTDEASRWDELLDELKVRNSIKSDAKLAAELGISPAALAHARVGRQPLPLRAKVELWSKLRREFTLEMVIDLLPNEVRARILQDTGRTRSMEADGAGSRSRSPKKRSAQ